MAEIDWAARFAAHIGPGGCVIVPPRIARWLDRKSGMTYEKRIALRDTDPEAYSVLAALRMVALTDGETPGSANGTKVAEPQRNQQDSEAWLTTAEAAKLTGVTDRCIRKWIATQRLPARRHGGRWVIDRQHVNIAQALAA